MRQSQLFGSTDRNAPHDADSPNARLLIQAGFVSPVAAGVFSYLPLGLRALEKIKNIVREEMNALGASEVYMPALLPKELFNKTGRWDKIDVLFKLEGHGGKEYALGATHEEAVTPLVMGQVKSYKQLPVAVYQIQDKFRNEPRAKSGLLRGREFSMKDLYSFHLDEDDFQAFYERTKEAYLRVYQRCGLDALVVEADGGVFSKFSHEFQVLTPSGEDLVYHCDACDWAQNKEIVKVEEGTACPGCGKGTAKVDKAIEVGNIFPLKTRFSDAFGFRVQGPDGEMKDVLMGCYGIGPSRVMGSIVEVHHDDAGMIWPKGVAPYHVHLISIPGKDDRVIEAAEGLHKDLEAAGVEVLWDDREDARAGEKFADADLIGLPLRLVISEKTLAEDSIEWKERHEADARLVKMADVIEEAQAFVNEPYETTSHIA